MAPAARTVIPGVLAWVMEPRVAAPDKVPELVGVAGHDAAAFAGYRHLPEMPTEKSTLPQKPEVSEPTYELASDAAAAVQEPKPRLSRVAAMVPLFFMVMVVVSGEPAGTWSSVPTSLLIVAHVAELVPTVPPPPLPVE